METYVRLRIKETDGIALLGIFEAMRMYLFDNQTKNFVNTLTEDEKAVLSDFSFRLRKTLATAEVHSRLREQFPEAFGQG